MKKTIEIKVGEIPIGSAPLLFMDLLRVAFEHASEKEIKEILNRFKITYIIRDAGA